MIERVGFIGLGDMGWPMAKNLCGGPFDVMVHDLFAERMKELEAEGAQTASDAAEVGAHSQIVGICVVDDATTEAVADEVLSRSAPDTILAIHGTVSPGAIQRLVALAKQKDCHVVDAQVTGGRTRALDRKLRYMVGADGEVFMRCKPVFSTSAEEVTHCGPVGTGSVAKICNNLVQFQAWTAYVEADQLARRAGLSREKLFEVLAWIMNDNARTFLSVRSVLVDQPDNQALKERFTSVMDLATKDLSLALDLAKSEDLKLPGTDLTLKRVAHLFGLNPEEAS